MHMLPNKKLSTEPYKGVRDFYPEDMFIQKHIFGIMRQAVEKFGYVEYGASVLEPAEMYRAKSSNEIVNEQTYTFTDRGDREVTLRPEMTPTVARMVSAKRRELGFPLRWYSIPNLFRYEKPQRGRVREHWQLNVDLFGPDTVEADIEIIAVAAEIMKSFGAKSEDYTIRINSRKLLQQAIEGKLIDPATYPQAIRLIDSKAKMTDAAFAEGWKKLSNESLDLNILANERINTITKTLHNLGIDNAIYDPVLARGFDYYTDVVFEVFDTNPENSRSLFGGGRYDDLASLFDGEKIPAIGFGMGDVTIRDFLETRGLLPAYAPSAQVFIAIQDPAVTVEADALAQRMRAAGLNVAINLSSKKIGDQIKVADKQKIPYVIVVGPQEVASGSYPLKKMALGTDETLSESDLIAYLKNWLLAR